MFGILNKYTDEFWTTGVDNQPHLFESIKQAQAHLNDEAKTIEFDSDEGSIQPYPRTA